MSFLKKCTSCRETKASSEFRKQNGTKDGLQYRCIFCSDQAAKNRYLDKKEELIEQSLEYQAQNPEKVKAAAQKYKASPLGKFNRRLNNRLTDLLGDKRDTFFHLIGLSAAALFEYLGNGEQYNKTWLVGFKVTPSKDELVADPRRWLHWENLISIEKVNKNQKDIIIV